MGLCRISESLRSYAYLILSSHISARSHIVQNTASALTTQKAFLDNFENVVNHRVDILEDIKCYQDSLSYTLSKVDYSMGKVFTSDMNLKIKLFLDNMIRSGHRRLARSFNLCYRYIDDLIVFNNKKFLDYLKEIYPSQLTVEKANKSDHLADYLDLTFMIDSGGKLSTRLYDKRDDFDFHIVNFPYLSSNIPSGPSYGVYISQLIRYA